MKVGKLTAALVATSMATLLTAGMVSPDAYAQVSVNYGYDTQGRLKTSTVVGGATTTYGYDAANNRTSLQVAGSSSNHPPVCANKTINIGAPSYAGPISMSIDPVSSGGPACTDADGDTLTLLSVSSFTRGGYGFVSSSNLASISNITAGGGTTFVYTVSDGHGGVTSANFTFYRA